MGLFGRRRGGQRAGDSDLPTPGDRDVPGGDDARPADRVSAAPANGAEAASDSAHRDAGGDQPYEPPTAFSRLRGPFDRSEVTESGDFLDLGGIWLPRVDGLELRLEVDQQTQTIIGAQIVRGRSTAQIQAFAAPRTAGMWPELRGEIAAGVVAQGGTAEVVDGTLGKELRVFLPGSQAMRFLGVDGPRWFLRAVLGGPAASDDTAAAELVDIVRRVVVVRGEEAMPPREIIALRLPEEAAQDRPDPVSAPGDPDRARNRDELRPFDRGPEITEVH